MFNIQVHSEMMPLNPNNQQCQIDASRTIPADRVWLIIEPSLKNFAPSEIPLLSEFLAAKLCEYHATAELEAINPNRSALLENGKQGDLSRSHFLTSATVRR
jgi:hypothetical protein